MDGCVLPAIIFTNCPTVPADIDQGWEGKVIYLPDMTAPSADMTLSWLEEVGDCLMDSPLLVHDRGNEFTARDVQQELGR